MMLRPLAKVLLLTLLVVGGSVGIVFYRDNYSADRHVAELEQEKLQLQQIVQRLTDERRVAQLLVTDQKTVNGSQQTSLLLVEYARDGSLLMPKSFTIKGNVVHIDAMVIKFDRPLVEQNDPLRGHSIALFHRLFGDEQTPEQAFPIDQPDTIPDYYRTADPRVSTFEQNLWNDFWRLTDDPAYRQSKGVRIANGQGIWLPVAPDKVYTISIESDGGLNYASEPLKGASLDAMRRRNGI